jgi:hypothetical protein
VPPQEDGLARPKVVERLARPKVVQGRSHAGFNPRNKGREYVCRRLLRHVGGGERFGFQEWVEEERRLLGRRLREGRRSWRRNRDRPASWWWETFGILPEEIPLLHGDP